MSYSLRPPYSSDSDEDDKFYYGSTVPEEDKYKNRFHWIPQSENSLYDVVKEGDIKRLKEKIINEQIDVDAVINDSTLLLIACKEGYLDIVKFLILEQKANVNKQVDSITPLMNACDSYNKDKQIVGEIVLILVTNGAVINVSSKYGVTPFMLACKNGFRNVVSMLIKDASLESVDNFGYSPIFFAIEGNHEDIVKMLVDVGVSLTTPNGKGYTPHLFAEYHGHFNILELLPKKEEVYHVPIKYKQYNSIRDHIPQLFLKSECPEYFPEISSILKSVGMEKLLEYFAKGNVSLAEFLCMTDEELKALGIKLPFYRTKIALILLDYHLYHWSAKAIGVVKKSETEKFSDIFMIAANHLQQIIITKASLRYITKNIQRGQLGTVENEDLRQFSNAFKAYRKELEKFSKIVKYLRSFSPKKNILHIDFDEIVAERKARRIKRYAVLTSLLIGVSALAYYKFK
ncbi:uncharacterized protein LOC119678568 [Teleopsis dalmanni]|uniref:uncharacterized protein LOC119678568 n=1 Tax=Teleopsis dalmanni TaxID=139649 RepID=UPI0018CDD147|nr:uncharacterized protein LOC119678568 [Teleopsis dalmanni]